MRDSPEPDVKRPRTCHGYAAWPVSTVPVPLDQGEQKTCVHHAVATATAQGLLSKNGIVIMAERLAEKFEDHVPGWQGLTIAKFCDKWNEHCSSIWIKNVDSSERYNLRLEASDPIVDIGAAYEKLEQVRGVLMLVCAVKHGNIASHAVTVDMPYRARPNMRAINSWGAVHPVIDVTPATFQYATLIEPVVVTWAKGGGAVRTTAYKCTTAYHEMKEQEPQEQEDEDPQKKEEQEEKIVTEAGGMQLHLSRKSQTGYLGVYPDKNRFKAQYGSGSGGTMVHLGNFETAVEAAVAYAKHAWDAAP